MRVLESTTCYLLFMAAVLSLTALSGCKKDDEKPHDHGQNHEEELITSLVLNFTEVGSQIPVSFEFAFRDTDGPGGNDPVQFDTITLPAGTVWDCSITLLNESSNPAVDLTEEIHHEGDEHIFCFEPAGAAVGVVITDSDGALPIGLLSEWTIGAAGTGTITVKLKHQPGIKDGSCTPGETDIEVAFPLVIN